MPLMRVFEKPVSRGAIIYYPPQPESAGVDRFGVGPHTDFGTLTLLYQDGVGGLQVQNRDGEWLTATPIEGTLVVNVTGSLLLGFGMQAMEIFPVSAAVRTTVAVGFLGAFTTFSTFSYETVVMLRDGEWWRAGY